LARAVLLFNRAAAEAKGGWQPQLPLEMAFIEAAIPPEPENSPPRGQSAPTRSHTPNPVRRSTSSTSSKDLSNSSEASNPASGQSGSPARAQAPSRAGHGADAVREPKPAYPSPDSGHGSLTPEVLRDRWSDLLDALRPRNLSLEALIRACEPVSVEGDVVVLGFAHDFHRSKVEEERNKRDVEDVLSTLAGRPFRVRCVLLGQEGDAQTSRRAAADDAILMAHRADAPPSDERMIAEDPVVRAAVEDLGARIVR